MLKIITLMLLLSVAWIVKGQEHQEGHAGNYNIESRIEDTESNNYRNVRNNQNENEKNNDERYENGNENWNENWNANENENAARNENWNRNEKRKNSNGHSPAENTHERLIDEGTGQEYEIVGYLYPPSPPAQPYYYEVPLV